MTKIVFRSVIKFPCKNDMNKTLDYFVQKPQVICVRRSAGIYLAVGSQRDMSSCVSAWRRVAEWSHLPFLGSNGTQPTMECVGACLSKKNSAWEAVHSGRRFRPLTPAQTRQEPVLDSLSASPLKQCEAEKVNPRTPFQRDSCFKNTVFLLLVSVFL